MKKLIPLLLIVFSINLYAEEIIYQTDLHGVWFLYFENQIIGPYGELYDGSLFWHDQKIGFEVTFLDNDFAILKLKGPDDIIKCIYTFNKNRNGLGYLIEFTANTQKYYLHLLKRDNGFTAVFFFQQKDNSFALDNGIIRKVKELQ